MLDKKIIERLQAGAIINPDNPVPMTVHGGRVYILPASRIAMMQYRAEVHQPVALEEDDLAGAAAEAERVLGVVDRFAAQHAVRAEGFNDAVTGKPLDVDLQRLSQFIGVDEAIEVVRDINTISAELLGKSNSPSPSSGADGRVSKSAAAKASATNPASRRRPTGRRRKTSGSPDARSARP